MESSLQQDLCVLCVHIALNNTGKVDTISYVNLEHRKRGFQYFEMHNMDLKSIDIRDP